MSREYTVDDIVTEFLLNTCRLRAPPCIHAANAVLLTSYLMTKRTDFEIIALTTGSLAEFYVEPMLPHVGDIDVMWYHNDQLVIPRGYPPPTQLPAEFHNRVHVVEIIDSHLPGYVYLPLRYLLTQRTDDGTYDAVEYDRERYVSNISSLPKCLGLSDTHGPAYCIDTQDTELSTDHVRCMRCLSWPPQAADWLTRHRNYGWPDSATLDRIVSNGCDVVGVAHRQCTQHEWMGKFQHRLSFSRAEIVLINSWMPIQQIVYHMLRHFVKTERLTDCADNSRASNYHIKTLMLWACELKPRRWWTDDVNLVRNCVELLHILAEWLTYRRCQHYFISSCNLIDNSFNVTNIRDQLMSIDETWLAMWFVDNYMQKCLQLSPDYISRLFCDVRTRVELKNAISTLVAWKQNNSVFDVWLMFVSTEQGILFVINDFSLDARSCVYFMTELEKIDSRLSVYFTAVAFLHVACRSLRHGLSDEMLDVLATACGQFISKRRYTIDSASRLALGQAVKLMKVMANKSLSTTSLIEIELSKAYLYRALRCKDSDSDSIYCLANVYLAVLYYTTGQYQTAIDHCTLVTRSQDQSQCSSHVVQGEVLPTIDDDVDNMLGLSELYHSVRTAALKQKRQPQLVSVFTTELFAYYMRIRCLSVTKCHQFVHMSTSYGFKRYGVCIYDTQQLFIGDVLLFLSVRRRSKFLDKSVCPKPQRTLINTNECNTSDLGELLQKSAVEHLTTYRRLVARDFGCVATIVTTDFEALYAYKRGDYQQCLQLSTQNVQTLLYADFMQELPLLPPFLYFFDDEMLSLTALTLMVNPECRHTDRYARITQLTLSLYLTTRCQLKLLHSVSSVAQILEYSKIAKREMSAYAVLDHLTLKLIKRIIVSYVNR